MKPATLLNQIIAILATNVGNEILYLDSPIVIKRSPHDQNTYRIWAVCFSPDKHLFVTDDPTDNESWYKVDGSDELIIPSVYQRLCSVFPAKAVLVDSKVSDALNQLSHLKAVAR